MTITCHWRILPCDHCSEPYPKCNMQDHIVQCSKFPVACPNICGRSIPREMVLNHTENDCPLTIIPCPYSKTGCEIKLQRKQVECHLQSATSFHLELACVKLENTEFRLTNTEAKLLETQVKLSNTEEATRKLTEKLDILQRQFENKLADGQGKATEEKRVMVKTGNALFPREFIWKITDFSDILTQAKTEENKMIESVPFYTEQYGYKLKVEVYPNGRKSGNNTHLSVYISVMKGEYDAILPWPFKKKVRITFIDQQENPGGRENVVMRVFLGDHLESSARPINERNKRRGHAEFISHDKLHSRRYLVDDILFLRVEVG